MAVKKSKGASKKKTAARKKPAPKAAQPKAAQQKAARPKAVPKAAASKPAARRSSAPVKARTRPSARKSTAVAPTPEPSSTSAPPKKAKQAWLFPPVVHWEIQAVDAGRQRGFYADLFGWPIDANNPQNYGMVASGGEGAIAGGIGPGQDGKSYVTFYVEVPDIEAALGKAESLGGTTVMPRMDIGMVVLAQFRDPEGNVIGLIESRPAQ